MSYCRWSSDNFKCDLYCYASVANTYVTHVAGNKTVEDPPIVPDIDFTNYTEEAGQVWTEARHAQHKFLEVAERQPLGLPHDGKTFTDNTLEEFLDRILYLQSVGYRVPQYTFDRIGKELAEEQSNDLD